MHLIEKIHKQMNPPTQGHYVINNTFKNTLLKLENLIIVEYCHFKEKLLVINYNL